MRVSVLTAARLAKAGHDVIGVVLAGLRPDQILIDLTRGAASAPARAREQVETC